MKRRSQIGRSDCTKLSDLQRRLTSLAEEFEEALARSWQNKKFKDNNLHE